ncbi:hypothetical protein AB4090_15015 [Acidithiobacillus sp. IBUN Pt1247-S3]|uniref:hypothetical protein n=1 Tax=Acidithiobacillus sp. IBUN Pt1247-S3 TaxID=3166642 RepID=UPI0034E3770B
MEKTCALDTREVVELLCDIADQVSSIVGEKGAISVFRYAGRALGKKLAAGKHGSAEDARAMVSTFFVDKEFMDHIQLQDQNAELSGCRIGRVLAERNVHPGSHALCHFGFGRH